jgi:K+/H+ antiporter YhaU regulatory subunit KhtT
MRRKLENKTQPSSYMRIAIDLAHRICNEEFKENDKVRGRSTLAGEYNVSPETIRRSTILLSETGVVEVRQRSGIFIKSKKNAYNFIQKFSTKENISLLRSNLEELIKKKAHIEKEIKNNVKSLIEYSTQLKYTGLINTFEYEISGDSPVIRKTIAELHFWQNTGATVIGIYRNNQLIISPGPDFAFEERDVVIFTGAEDVTNRVKKFIK